MSLAVQTLFPSKLNREINAKTAIARTIKEAGITNLQLRLNYATWATNPSHRPSSMTLF